MTDADRLKRAAAERAVELLEDGMVVGLGTGSTARHVIDVITAINTARASRTDVELGTILAANAAARNTVQGAAYLYVPLDPYGCTFQPLARQEEVRKGGK